MTVVPMRGPFGGKRYRCRATAFDESTLRVEASEALSIGQRVKVRLQLPRAVSNFFRGLPCEFEAKVRDVRPLCTNGAVRYLIVLNWEQELTQLANCAIRSYQFKIGTMLVAVLSTVVWLKWRNLDYFWYSPFFYVYSVTLLTYLVSRFFLSWRHKDPPYKGLTPTISIVISVRNEERAIAATIQSCYEADYPEHKREVIVVDDGSSDGTPKVLAEMRERYSDLQVITLKPSGKRFGMAAGVRQATGDIVVFVDSDTFLFHDALRRIVCGFEDPTLGASAGYTEVENADKNALTGLQEVRYFVSYRLLKSSESLYSCVTCCPGCLSAYRRKYLLEILEPWLNQKFLGRPATFGDDRSLTNFILRKYRVIYNESAVASTIVPETWGHYLRQQVRWKKSWLRETLIASRYMHRKAPIAAISFYAAAGFSLLSPAMLVRVFYLESTMRISESVVLFYVFGLIMVGLLQSLYFLYRRPSPHWLLGMLWMASSMLLTGPQTYYAMLTIRKNHWGTR
ncbi:MAG: glycosyltransferase family 2 protein [Elusimicrobia bacterium]|nr:glycosyltransferase family 2 protein [Elusimicrobiota bacterium]